MKARTPLLIGILLINSAVAFAQVKAKITFPSFGGLLGPKTHVSVTNTVPFYARLFALNKEVAKISPGASVYNQRRFEFKYTALPMTALLYSDKGYQNYIGAAGKVIRIRRGQANSWNIKLSDVYYVDGRSRSYGSYGYGSPYPAPDVGTGGKKVDFPRIGLMSTTAVQLVNNTLFDARVRLNGHDRAIIRTGKVYYLSLRNLASESGTRRVNIEVIFTDRGRLEGYFKRTVSVSNSPQAYQFILNPSDIRRY